MSALRISNILKKRGHEIVLLCPANSKLGSEATNSNLNVISVFRERPRRGKMGAIRKLLSILNKDKYDVIHTHLSHDLWTIVPALKLSKLSKGAKLVLTKHMASGVMKTDFFHRILYGRVNKIISVSDFIKKSVIKTCPVREDKVVTIHDAVSLNKFDPMRFNKKAVKQELGLNDADIVVGMIGRMTPGKGYEEFMEAAAKIKRNSNVSVRFLISGGASRGEDNYANGIRELANRLGLSDEIIFTGFRADIPYILSAIDIIAFPSHEESFGITLVEAMAMGIPAAASRSAGVLEIVENGKNGILVPPKDSASLANAITGLIENPELRKKFAAEGRKRAEEEFDLEKMIEKLEAVYKE